METKDLDSSFTKLIYLLKRSTDDWVNVKLCCGDQELFNPGYLPIFMTVAHGCSSNNELAKKLKITKQGASKVTKELEDLDLVMSIKNQNDARLVALSLTDKGTRLYKHIMAQLTELEEGYKMAVGEKNYQIALDVIRKLTNFHETQKQTALKECF